MKDFWFRDFPHIIFNFMVIVVLIVPVVVPVDYFDPGLGPGLGLGFFASQSKRAYNRKVFRYIQFDFSG